MTTHLQELLTYREQSKDENARRVAKREIMRRPLRMKSRPPDNPGVMLVPKDVVISDRIPRPYDLANRSAGWNFAQNLDVIYDEVKFDKKKRLSDWGSPWPGNTQAGIYQYVRDVYDQNTVNLDVIDHIMARHIGNPDIYTRAGSYRQAKRTRSRTKPTRKFKSRKRGKKSGKKYRVK